MQALRRSWRQISRGLDSTRLICLDETGLNLALTRRYARASLGERAIGSVPANYGQNLTVLAASSCHGILAAMMVPGATDGTVFQAFLEHVLVPQRRPGDHAVIENLRAHKVAGIAELVQATGATLPYLPPYSLDLNPIEQAWSKIKTRLRAVGTSTRPKLQRALKAALPEVTAQDATAWFRHARCTAH